MVDLSVNFAGLELKTPFVVASCENARDIRQIKKAEKCGASAVILKAMGPPGSVLLNSKLRTYIDIQDQAVFGGGGSKWLSYDEGVELIRATKAQTGIKIGANMAFPMFGDYQYVVDAAKRTAKAGADFVEINFKGIPYSSTRATGNMVGEQNKAQGYGEYVGRYLSRVVEGTRTIKEAVNIPVIDKIDPQMGDIVASALAMENGGADAVDVANIMGGSVAIDIFNRGSLKMPAARKAILTTVGAPYKPFAQGFVTRIAKATNIPILGSGGLMNWKDAVEMMMFGAKTVSFCTLLMMKGFEAIAEIEKNLREYMDKQGFSRVDDFRGLSLDYIMSEFRLGELIPSVARIDKDKCTGCGICLKPAHCLAITLEKRMASVNETECLGCGTCSLLCQSGAVSMEEI
jgi:dihydropyrimidine dehydrogenase (NAD+) subunit PreA